MSLRSVAMRMTFGLFGLVWRSRSVEFHRARLLTEGGTVALVPSGRWMSPALNAATLASTDAVFAVRPATSPGVGRLSQPPSPSWPLAL